MRLKLLDSKPFLIGEKMYTRSLHPVKELKPGLDLPRWFIDDMLSVDDKFHFVFHRWRLLWDDLMNYQTGSQEDPRFAIDEFHGQECWGWPLTDNEGEPVPENRWHVWRRVNDFGYYHVIDLASRTDPIHLNRVVNLIGREAKLRDKGRKAYMEAKREAQEAEMLHLEEEKADKFGLLSKENAGLVRKAKENFERGHTAPTNPQKDVIMSYKGQKNRSRIVRPVSDEEAGLVTWED